MNGGANNVVGGKDGNVYRKQGQNWQTREGNQWKHSQPRGASDPSHYANDAADNGRRRGPAPHADTRRRLSQPTSPGTISRASAASSRHRNTTTVLAGLHSITAPAAHAVAADAREAPAAGAERIMISSHRAASLAAMTAILLSCRRGSDDHTPAADSAGREVAVPAARDTTAATAPGDTSARDTAVRDRAGRHLSGDT